MGGEGGKRHEVSRGSGVNQERELHAEQGGEFLLEGFALGSEGQPEIESRTDRCFDLVLIEDAAGVGNGLAGSPRRVGGVIAGALLGGPIGAVIGGNVGLASGAVVDPPEQVRTYVTTNKVDPVYLDGEVVVGSAIPKTVRVYQVPDYKYQYAYVNGRTVLVEPESNKIVYVYR